jgi:hypothetical protein
MANFDNESMNIDSDSSNSSYHSDTYSDIYPDSDIQSNNVDDISKSISDDISKRISKSKSKYKKTPVQEFEEEDFEEDEGDEEDEGNNEDDEYDQEGSEENEEDELVILEEHFIVSNFNIMFNQEFIVSNLTVDKYYSTISRILSNIYVHFDSHIFQMGYKWSSKYIHRKFPFMIKSKYTPKKYLKDRVIGMSNSIYMLHRLDQVCKRLYYFSPKQYVIKRNAMDPLCIDLDMERKVLYVFGWIATILQILLHIFKKLYKEKSRYSIKFIVDTYKNHFNTFFKNIRIATN